MDKVKVFDDSRFGMPALGLVLFRDMTLWVESDQFSEINAEGKKVWASLWANAGKLVPDILHDYNGDTLELSNCENMEQYLSQNRLAYAVVS